MVCKQNKKIIKMIFFIFLNKKMSNTVDNYINDLNITYEELPSFARIIFSNKLFKHSDKIKIKDFLIDYMNNVNDYQHEFEGNYIVFINRKLDGIYSSNRFEKTNSKFDFDIGKDEIITVKITKNQEFCQLNNLGQTTIKGKTNDENSYKCFSTNCSIKYNNEEIFQKYIIDTGAYKTVIPHLHKWNYKTLKYDNKNLGRRSTASMLNENIVCSDIVETKCVGNIVNFYNVIFKKSVDFSINGLHPVKIPSMIVPVEKTNVCQLLGIDIICKHTMIISSTNNAVDIKFYSNESINPIVENDKFLGIFKRFDFSK